MPNNLQNAPWPTPVFHFLVKINGQEIQFQEVSGLDSEHDVIEYRSGNSPQFSTVKMPGLKKHSDVTLKKGVFSNDAALFDYFNSVKMGTPARQTVEIFLIDENGARLFVWTLQNAFPKKITGASLNAETSDAAIEEIVLAHEGLKMEKG
jgi:phage tail-like protein